MGVLVAATVLPGCLLLQARAVSASRFRSSSWLVEFCRTVWRRGWQGRRGRGGGGGGGVLTEVEAESSGGRAIPPARLRSNVLRWSSIEVRSAAILFNWSLMSAGWAGASLLLVGGQLSVAAITTGVRVGGRVWGGAGSQARSFDQAAELHHRHHHAGENHHGVPSPAAPEEHPQVIGSATLVLVQFSRGVIALEL